MRLQLRQGDCIDLMSELPSESIDMILCDLPYGTTKCKWDTVVPFKPLWEQYRRIAKRNAAIVLTACQPFTSALVMSAPDIFRYDLVWHKNKASGHLNAKVAPLRAHESVLVFSKRKTLYFPQKTDGHRAGNRATRRTQSEVYGKEASFNTWGGSTQRYPRSVVEVPVENNDSKDRWHPTQKPVALMEYLIRTYSQIGDLVLDNCMGSGTTGVASARNGRRFIGMEKDPDYYERAKQRVEAAYADDGFGDG